MSWFACFLCVNLWFVNYSLHISCGVSHVCLQCLCLCLSPVFKARNNTAIVIAQVCFSMSCFYQQEFYHQYFRKFLHFFFNFVRLSLRIHNWLVWFIQVFNKKKFKRKVRLISPTVNQALAVASLIDYCFIYTWEMHKKWIKILLNKTNIKKLMRKE